MQPLPTNTSKLWWEERTFLVDSAPFLLQPQTPKNWEPRVTGFVSTGRSGKIPNIASLGTMLPASTILYTGMYHRSRGQPEHCLLFVPRTILSGPSVAIPLMAIQSAPVGTSPFTPLLHLLWWAALAQVLVTGTIHCHYGNGVSSMVCLAFTKHNCFLIEELPGIQRFGAWKVLRALWTYQYIES